MTAVLDLVTGLHVDGEWGTAAATFAVEDPATGAVLAEVADAGPADGERALAAALETRYVGIADPYAN
jgi:succinate-semialdehyde dehydrogenase/glutarate-semialdehyde dehydrogenase